ncbi:phytanoyl-CoA dioxygenase family protein [Aquidulcibacter paucihalophilus]|uniref:phytanoyl-CoA dioxygenase family protein n=1 Tax=Aquidulcibacter paucihalophilus TaxID=1978549 RepID=UPI000A1927BA|nr:phytanoyl-CoA dioxygenase family protein [Aquidulcibacter paucihalophilus]
MSLVLNPDLDRPFALKPEQLQKFEKDGFIHLKSVMSPAVLAEYGREITKLTITLNTQTKPLQERTTYDRAFLQVMNLWEQSERVKAFLLGKTLGRIATELMGVRGVRLYHDQSLYKEPGGGITPAHADQYYWPLSSDRTITAWIPLQDVPAEMGPLSFYAGSQHEAFGRDLGISDESEAAITAMMEARRFPLIQNPYGLGDVSFHLGWTFHKAGPNVSTKPRSVMTIIYMDVDMVLQKPTNGIQEGDWVQWCPGARIGEIIQTPKNPIIYERATC